MNEDQARQIAEKFIASLNMRGWKAVFVGVRRDKNKTDVWSVAFDHYSPEGHQVDSPLFVDVNEVTETATVEGAAM